MGEITVHRVLLVGDENKVRRFLGTALEIKNIKDFWVGTGEDALKVLKTSRNKFSLIISDQRLPGIPGTQFLEKARQTAPDSLRYLLTRYSDMGTIKDSVNKGSVHRYLLKTEAQPSFSKPIRSGLEQYEIRVDAKKKLNKARLLNKKLYYLDRNLIDAGQSLENEHKLLDQEIADLENRLSKAEDPVKDEPEDIIKQAGEIFEQGTGITLEKIDLLFAHTLKKLYAQFDDISRRNGFEMPKPISDDPS